MQYVMCRTLLVCLLALVIFGCSHGAKRDVISGGTGPLDTYHLERHPWGDDATIFGGPRSESLQGQGVEGVGLEMTSCYGFCPQFTVIFCVDGTAWYCGRANTEPLGCYTGKVPISEFKIVAAAMEDVGFFELDHTYADLKTDDSSALVAGLKEGRVVVVRDYAESAPPRLWLLEFLLGSMVDRVTWDPIDAKTVDFNQCDSG